MNWKKSFYPQVGTANRGRYLEQKNMVPNTKILQNIRLTYIWSEIQEITANQELKLQSYCNS